MCGDSDRNADAIGQVMFSHCYDGTGHRQRYCTKPALRRSSKECLRNRQRAGRRPDSRTILGPESLRSVAAGPSGSEIPDPSRFRPELVRMRPSDGAANRFAYIFLRHAIPAILLWIDFLFLSPPFSKKSNPLLLSSMPC